MKRWISVFILAIVLMFVPSFAHANDITNVDISVDYPTILYIGESVTLNTSRSIYTYTVNDETICTYSSASHRLTGVKEGATVINKVFTGNNSVVGKYLIVVKEREDSISISGVSSIRKGETYTFTAEASDDYVFSSSDESIISINEEGVCKAMNVGLCSIRVSLFNNPLVYDEMYVLVSDDNTYDLKEETVDIDLSDPSVIFSNIAKHSAQSMMIVTSYMSNRLTYTELDQGCGFVYKRIAHMNDGSTTEDFDIDFEKLDYFEYFFVTNKHLVSKTTYSIFTGSNTVNADLVKLYDGNKNNLIASICAYDLKVDLAVLTFNSKDYYPTANIGSSSELKEGELLIAIGTGESEEYFTTTTFGICSHPKRYISDDTDLDGTNDWDAEYIQHDAAINSLDCGSLLINLKGEVIGINTAKKIVSSSGVKVDNLAFAIPSDLMMDLIPSLEKGEVPERPVIGVTVISVLDILADREYYATYGDIIIPDDVPYGFYVDSTVEGGIAETAGILPKDIILKFNDNDLVYLYQMRSELDHYIVGSGDTATLKVLRDGQVIEIELVF